MNIEPKMGQIGRRDAEYLPPGSALMRNMARAQATASTIATRTRKASGDVA